MVPVEIGGGKEWKGRELGYGFENFSGKKVFGW